MRQRFKLNAVCSVSPTANTYKATKTACAKWRSQHELSNSKITPREKSYITIRVCGQPSKVLVSEYYSRGLDKMGFDIIK